MTQEIMTRALELISKGFTPVPLNGKAPTVKDWQTMKVAVQNVDEWNFAGLLHNLGLRTGDNGVIVLDFDGLGGYEAFIAAFPELVTTYTVKTGGGKGMHVYLKLPGELPRSTGQLIAPGGFIEIKAKGRQVVIPPSIHPDTGQPYVVHTSAPIKAITSFAPIQQWIDELNPKPEYQPTPEPAPVTSGEFAAYARAALANIAGDLARLAEGGRNTACNRMAWMLAHYVRRGDLTEGEVRAALEGAMFANGSVSENGKKAFEATFASGFSDGYGDTSFEPEIYKRPRAQQWQGQKTPARQMPGDWQGYTPPEKAVSANGVVVIGRTRIIKRTSLFAELDERIGNDDYKPAVPPVIFPLMCLHTLGGQARVTNAGKVMALVGASGSGKTSALETIADAYVKAGVPVWMWTPEWTPDEMGERAIQRYGGPTQDQLYEHEIDNYRKNVLGQPSNPNHRLTEEQRTVAAGIMRHIREWKEDVQFVENSLLTVDELAEVVAAAKTICDPFPRVLITDYAQLLKANEVEEKDEISMYGLIQKFKSLCMYYGLIGVMATQTTKAEARNTNNGEVFKGTSVLNCTKNSRGRKGRVRVQASMERLCLIDSFHPNQKFEDDDYYLGSQAGRFINDDAFNLWITLNPEYE